VLGVLGANPIWAGEESRAKDAKDAKVKSKGKGKKDDEIAGVLLEWRFAWTRKWGGGC
jgi:hypothetical protein